MTQSTLQALMPELLAIDDDDVDAPQLPMAVALQEANDVAVLLSDGEVAAALVAVGVDTAAIERLAALIDGAREAQSRWVVARDRTKDEAQRQREQDGAALRSDLLAACRWNLRDSRSAQATLTAIAAGAGTADLIQDLNDLAELISKHAASFAADQTFEPSARAEAAQQAATSLAAGLSGERHDTDQQQAKRLRDRAFTLLDDQLSLLREAGRYRFRADPTLAAKFSSAYLRRRRRAANRHPDAPAQADAPATVAPSDA